MNPQETLLKYEELKIKQREIEKELDELKPIVTELIPEDAEVAVAYGSFYIQKRPKWTYSNIIINGEKALKEHKKQEEADGTATATFTPILYYRTESDK